MFAQVVRVQVQPGKIEEALDIFKNSLLPAAQQQNGFRSIYILVDRTANKATGFSLWETQGDVAALMESGFYQEQVAKFAAVFAAPPEREVYEVALQA